jgi:hypothetical protein
MRIAATAGNSEFCKHLRSLDCPWDAQSTAVAARNGHCDTLRFLRAHGCPWDVSDFINGLKGASFACADPLPVLQYWAEQGALQDAELLRSLLKWAGSDNKLAVAVWVRQRGAAWPDQLHSNDRPHGSGTPWPAEMVAWARAEGCTAPTMSAHDRVRTHSCTQSAAIQLPCSI